jgi:hypothetical protein
MTDQDERRHEYERRRVAVAEELCAELLRTCPDAVVEDEIGARNNAACRAALHAAVNAIMMDARNKVGDGWYAIGVRETGLRIISAVELSMYDPREHPERYGVDTQSVVE